MAMDVLVKNQIWVVNPLQGLWIPKNYYFSGDVNLHSVFMILHLLTIFQLF